MVFVYKTLGHILLYKIYHSAYISRSLSYALDKRGQRLISNNRSFKTITMVRNLGSKPLWRLYLRSCSNRAKNLSRLRVLNKNRRRCAGVPDSLEQNTPGLFLKRYMTISRASLNSSISYLPPEVKLNIWLWISSTSMVSHVGGERYTSNCLWKSISCIEWRLCITHSFVGIQQRER